MHRIPRELLPEIAERHARGQSDQAIADWLAHQDPPVTVSRVAVLQARKRAAPAQPAASTSPPAPSAASKPISAKPSGAQNKKAKVQQTAKEAADQKRRGQVIVNVAQEPDPGRAHLYELRVLLQLQHEINADKVMTLPDKARHSTAIAQAMGRIKTDAELELQIEALEKERAVETEKLEAERRKVELERRRNEADRVELYAAWAKLNEERSRQAAALQQAA